MVVYNFIVFIVEIAPYKHNQIKYSSIKSKSKKNSVDTKSVDVSNKKVLVS